MSLQTVVQQTSLPYIVHRYVVQLSCMSCSQFVWKYHHPDLLAPKLGKLSGFKHPDQLLYHDTRCYPWGWEIGNTSGIQSHGWTLQETLMSLFHFGKHKAAVFVFDLTKSWAQQPWTRHPWTRFYPNSQVYLCGRVQCPVTQMSHSHCVSNVSHLLTWISFKVGLFISISGPFIPHHCASKTSTDREKIIE